MRGTKAVLPGISHIYLRMLVIYTCILVKISDSKNEKSIVK